MFVLNKNFCYLISGLHSLFIQNFKSFFQFWFLFNKIQNLNSVFFIKEKVPQFFRVIILEIVHVSVKLCFLTDQFCFLLIESLYLANLGFLIRDCSLDFNLSLLYFNLNLLFLIINHCCCIIERSDCFSECWEFGLMIIFGLLLNLLNLFIDLCHFRLQFLNFLFFLQNLLFQFFLLLFWEINVSFSSECAIFDFGFEMDNFLFQYFFCVRCFFGFDLVKLF